MKKRLTLLAAVLMAALVAVLPSAAQADVPGESQSKAGSAITVHIDGALIQCDVPPIIENSRVFLPMRAAAEAMGASVVWDNASRSISVEKGDTTAYFVVGDTTYYHNGTAKESDVAPMIVNSRTLLPIRVFAESLGADVYWDNAARDVQITTSGTTTPSNPVAASFILNNNSHKFHRPTCSAVDRMTNPIPYQGTRESLISQGYTPCKLCNP